MAHPRMSAEIGRVLGGRYRLVAPIGMGASAQVYLADDVKLRRRVAVKMLHDALAGDAEFLRRFRAEARAAAALSHPNVMAVYDWGDDEVAFIVTEYLPGGSLRALLDSGVLLTPAQALGVGLEAARALDYAHRRGFVHRDVKPANLLFGEEQRLRIADFGLARALAEAAWTEPQGAVLGTARYASPEQAKGETLSGKADVYALALVIIESVVGAVPFVADTTLGTLMARLDRQVPVGEELGPLRRVLERAGHPDPERRIDARTLAAGLLRAANELSRPAPLRLAGALASGSGSAVDLDPTMHGPDALEVSDGAAAVGGDEAHEPASVVSDLTADDLGLDPPHWVNQAVPVVPVPLEPTPSEATSPGSSPSPEPMPGPGSVPEAEAVPEALDEVDEADGADEVDEVDVQTEAVGADSPGGEAPEAGDGYDPAVIDAGPAPDAVGDMSRAGTAPLLLVDESTEPSSDEGRSEVDDGHLEKADGGGVQGTEPDEGRARRRRWPWAVAAALVILGGGGAAVGVVLANQDDPAAEASPPLDLPVPRLAGLTSAEAEDVVQASGWEVTVTETRRDGSTRGTVLETTPAPGERLAAGGKVELVVSIGQVLREVPDDLVGMGRDDAIARLSEVELVGEVVEERHDEEVPAGVVIALADGTAGQIETGGTVGLVLSSGPAPRTVPDGLRGSTVSEATAALEAVQLRIATTESFSDDVAEGTIISVLPREGEQLARGEVVTVEVSKGPELRAVPSVAGADDLDEASAILEAAGFAVGNVSGPARGVPVGTTPAAGSMQRPGATIDIVMGRA